MDLKQLNTRNGRIAAGATVAAVLVLLVVLIVWAAGGDDGDDPSAAEPVAGGATSEQSTTSPMGSPGPTTTDTASSAASSTSLSQSSTAPVATTVPGSTSVAGQTTTVAATTTVATAPPTSVVEVPTGSLETLAPVPSNEVGDFGTGLLVSIVSLEAVEGTATVPGEIAGPAVEVTIDAVNDSDAPIDLQRAQLEVTYGPDRSPGTALSSGTEPLTGVLAPGATARGVYVYGVPADQREVINILVSYDVNAPIVVFEGPGPRA